MSIRNRRSFSVKESERRQDGSPMATATINVPSLELPENYVVVKDQDENEGMMEALVEAGIVRPTGLRVVVGYYSAPVAELLVAG